MRSNGYVRSRYVLSHGAPADDLKPLNNFSCGEESRLQLTVSVYIGLSTEY